uniref:Uncharacterized protein n=1 Tax=Plectus sambesii TaxID=2011161 RepID=A0A914V8Y3_9BILA
MIERLTECNFKLNRPAECSNTTVKEQSSAYIYRNHADDSAMDTDCSTSTGVIDAESFAEDEETEQVPVVIPLAHKIYYNDLVMKIIIGYIGNFKDRCNVELSSKRLRKLSRLCEYKPLRGSYDLLEATFQNADERLSFCLAGNKVDVPILIASRRRMINYGTLTNTQLPQTLDKISRYFDRIAGQMRRLRIGGLIHWEDVIGLLPNHQIVITSDFIKLVVEKCTKVDRLCLRNACIDHDAVQLMLADTTNFRRNLKELCLHSIWFDDLDDCDKFTAAFLPPKLRSLHLSDCCNKMLNLMAQELTRRAQTIDFCYMSLDAKSFDQAKPPRHAFRDLIGKSNRVAIEMRANCKSDYMFHALKDITRFDKVVWLELSLDKGCISSGRYAGAFKRLQRLTNLETLRISGHGYSISSSTMADLCHSLSVLTRLKEFVLRNAAWHLKEADYALLAQTLRKLTILGLDRCQFLTNAHLLTIIQNCPDLEAIYLVKCPRLTCRCLREALDRCQRLRALTAVGFPHIDQFVYNAIVDSRRTPELRSASLSGHKRPLESETEDRLRQRFPVVFALGKDKYAPRDFTYRMAREGYERYFDWVGKFGVCVSCRQYVNSSDDDEIN